MPYIDPERRRVLDDSINKICLSIKSLITDGNVFKKEKTTNEELLSICGDINYCFSRIATKLMGETSYSKIALITGVLENIKQEFYRRIAEDYEDKKMLQNGDVQEYSTVPSVVPEKLND